MGETMNLEQMDLQALLRIRDILNDQRKELDEDLSAIDEKLKGIIEKDGIIRNEQGSRKLVFWREDGKVQELDKTYTDSLKLKKEAEQALIDAGFWDIYREQSTDPGKIKAILDSEDCPSGLEDLVVESRGSFKLTVGKVKDPTAQQILDKQQEDRLKEEAGKVF